MKVNISGIGLIPGVGLLAPVYGRDLTKDKVARILNYASFKVYVAATGVRITKKNIDEIFGGGAKKAAAPTPPPAPVVEEPAPKKKASKKAPKKEEPVVEETPVEIEQVEEPVVLDEVVEAPAVEEPVEEVPAEEAIVDLDDVNETETTVEEEVPTYTSKKKKRR